jgi:hypothetical protein
MAKPKNDKKLKEKKKKIIKSKGYVISIKLQSTVRKGAQAYFDIVEHLGRNRTKKPTGNGNDKMMIRNYATSKIGNYDIIYGTMAKYTKLDGKPWIDEEDGSYSDVKTPPNKNPNPKEIKYVFVPVCHRFFIEKSSEVSLNAVVNLLRAATVDAVDKDEITDVNVDLSQHVYSEIFNAKEIRWINVYVSYTNDDTNKAAADIVDKQFKKAKIGKARMRFEADATKNIDVTEPFVKGVLDLSRTNGYAEARVKNEKYKTIKTEEHPQVFTVEQPEDIAWHNSVAEELLKIRKEEND